jgi:hypothetical protein
MCNLSAFVHRDILQPRDELTILFSCFLLYSVSYLGEAYLKPLFPQSQWATPMVQT